MKLALLTLLLCSGSVVVMAQGGSNYSSIGFGDIRRSAGALYDGMAGTSIAMPNDHGINLVNPALLGMSPFTRLQAGYRFNQQHITQGGQSTSQNNGELDGLLVLFAVDTAHGFGFSLGVVPYSSVDYLVQRELQTNVDGTTLKGRSRQSGTGGTSSINFGISGRLGNLYGGLSMQSLFGVITLADEITIDGYRERLQTSTAYDVRGFLFKAGAYYKLSSSFSLGGYVSAGANGSMNTVYRASSSIAGVTTPYYDSVVATTGPTQLPISVGIGASYRVGRALYGIDIDVSDHSNVAVNPRSNVTFGRSLRASIGMSVNASQYAASFWERWGFRAGAGYQQMYYTYNGANVDEVFGSAGFDFPLGASATVDAALQGGLRSPQGNGLSESFLRVTVTVSIGETWFRPFARD